MKTGLPVCMVECLHEDWPTCMVECLHEDWPTCLYGGVSA